MPGQVAVLAPHPGRQRKHGLETTIAQLEHEPPEFKTKAAEFIDGLVSHYVFDEGKLVVAHAGMKEELQEIQWSVGAEYSYNDKFFLRAGYHYEHPNKGNRKYYTLGAGFKMNVFSIDAGYVISAAQTNPLDQTLRFSLSFDMDGIQDLLGRNRW
jgi:hypothetical protein